jgi:hypothetical protein
MLQVGQFQRVHFTLLEWDEQKTHTEHTYFKIYF